MREFIEIDFIEAGERGSGDAIAIRHHSKGRDCIYVVDGGYSEDGQKLLDHIEHYYNNPGRIDHVILTHPDADHASGLEEVLRQYKVGRLWMNRPWHHVDKLMPMFERYQNRDRLISRLKSEYPTIADLEILANKNEIEICEAFSQKKIGLFHVLSPCLDFYLDLVASSDKTPVETTRRLRARDEKLSAAAWGEENLKGDTEGTTAENETSIVLFGEAEGNSILLTGDAGVRALHKSLFIAKKLELDIASPDWFQVPHHGSRRNLSSEVLDKLLGPIQPQIKVNSGKWGLVSANRNDEDHPKMAVIRALMHRGYDVFQTHGTLCAYTPFAPSRGWSAALPLEYPKRQED